MNEGQQERAEKQHPCDLMPTTEEETESDQEGDYKQHNCGNISASHCESLTFVLVSLASVLRTLARGVLFYFAFTSLGFTT